MVCDVRYWPSVCCYAVCGTGLAYAAMRRAVLSSRMARHAARARHRGSVRALGRQRAGRAPFPSTGHRIATYARPVPHMA
eukprot:3940411-Rhodomonas_salina.2